MHCSRSRCPSLGHRAPQITPGSAMKISLPQCSWESLFDPVQCGRRCRGADARRRVFHTAKRVSFFVFFYISHQWTLRFAQNVEKLNTTYTVQAEVTKTASALQWKNTHTHTPKSRKKTTLITSSPLKNILGGVISTVPLTGWYKNTCKCVLWLST